MFPISDFPVGASVFKVNLYSFKYLGVIITCKSAERLYSLVSSSPLFGRSLYTNPDEE